MPRKLTIEEIKKRLKDVHGDVVVLDESTYVGILTKARFIDKDYGEWRAELNSVCRGHGHPKRGSIKRNKSCTLSVDEIKKRLKKTHSNAVILDEGTYKNTKTKCRFIDKDYGDWWAKPSKVINCGQGHPERAIEKRKQTCLKRYGVEYVSQDEKIRNKIKQTCLKKYGVESSLQNDEIKEKIKQTNLKKYGTENPSQNDEIKEKIKQTCLKNYGVENPSQDEGIKEKKRKTSLKNYGVEYPMQNPEVKNKAVQTNLKKYGVGCSLYGEKIKEKTKQTNIKRYGVEYPMQNPEIALKNAKAQNNSYILYHWKTNEEIVCIASYEKATVEYLNKNEIDFEWQHKVFKMPNGKTFRPDCYLLDEDLWIEIKGYFRDDSKVKWDWFHKKHPNSELWDKAKLTKLKIL